MGGSNFEGSIFNEKKGRRKWSNCVLEMRLLLYPVSFLKRKTLRNLKILPTHICEMELNYLV